MIAELAVAAALLTGPAAEPPPPMVPVEGVVMWMEHQSSTIGFLGTPTGPGCYLLNIGTATTRQNVCVPREQYAGTHWFAYFRGVGYPAPPALQDMVADFLLP